MRNGQPVQRLCKIDIDCLDCGENIWCFSDEQLAELKTVSEKQVKP